MDSKSTLPPMPPSDIGSMSNGFYFICRNCKFGLTGQNGLSVQDGKLLYKGESIPIGG